MQKTINNSKEDSICTHQGKNVVNKVWENN